MKEHKHLLIGLGYFCTLKRQWDNRGDWPRRVAWISNQCAKTYDACYFNEIQMGSIIMVEVD